MHGLKTLSLPQHIQKLAKGRSLGRAHEVVPNEVLDVGLHAFLLPPFRNVKGILRKKEMRRSVPFARPAGIQSGGPQPSPVPLDCFKPH